MAPVQKTSEPPLAQESHRSDELFAENQGGNNSDGPYKDNDDVTKVKKPIEYKQASEDSYRNEGGIEKLVGHVTFDEQTFGNNDSMDNKKQNPGVSFDASVDQDQQQNQQKKKPKSGHTPITLQKYKTMTYREMKERERLRQSANVGPGTYKGNDLSFGKNVKNGVI